MFFDCALPASLIAAKTSSKVLGSFLSPDFLLLPFSSSSEEDSVVEANGAGELSSTSSSLLVSQSTFRLKNPSHGYVLAL